MSPLPCHMTRRQRRLECWPRPSPMIATKSAGQEGEPALAPKWLYDQYSGPKSTTKDNANDTMDTPTAPSAAAAIRSRDKMIERNKVDNKCLSEYALPIVERNWRGCHYRSQLGASSNDWPTDWLWSGCRAQDETQSSISMIKRNNTSTSSINDNDNFNNNTDKMRPKADGGARSRPELRKNYDHQKNKRSLDHAQHMTKSNNQYNKFNNQNLVLVILFAIVILIGASMVPIDQCHAFATTNNNNNINNPLVEVHEYNDAILTPYTKGDGQFGGTLLGTSQGADTKSIIGCPLFSSSCLSSSSVVEPAPTSPLIRAANETAQLKSTHMPPASGSSPIAEASRFIVTTSSQGSSVALGAPGRSINLAPGQQFQIHLSSQASQQPVGPPTQPMGQAADYRSLFVPAFVASSMVSGGGGQQQVVQGPPQPVATSAPTNGQQPMGQLQAESQLHQPSSGPATIKMEPSVGANDDSMMVAGSHKHKKMKKKKEKKHKEWKKGKKHKKKKYESKKKKGGAMKKKKGKKEKKKWGMEKKGHKKKGNFKKKKWGHKKKKKAGKKGGKKGHKFFKDKGHKKKGFKKVYHKEEWGKKKKWHDVKREKKWNTKHKKWKKKWEQEKGKKYKGKHMKKYHKKNKHGKKYKKEKKSKYKKHKGEKYKKGHKKKKEEYAKKKEGGKKKMKKKESKKKKG